MERQPEPRGRSVIPFDMRWRLGYHGVYTTRGIPKRAFGHFGFGGSGGWADPSRNLAVALIVNSGMGTPFGDTRVVRIGGAALACADRRDDRSPNWSWIGGRAPRGAASRRGAPRSETSNRSVSGDSVRATGGGTRRSHG
jgi:CubicO group peptidase (beta-lactamase class C family)